MQSYIGKALLSFLLVFLFVSLVHATLPENDENFQTIEWVALIPEDDLDALLNPPDFLKDIADGSDQDSVDLLQKNTQLDAKGKRFQKALVSTNVVNEYDGKSIRIPGFIVPLESAGERIVTEFFVVPYFGACLHIPPPPPNQIIHVVVIICKIIIKILCSSSLLSQIKIILLALFYKCKDNIGDKVVRGVLQENENKISIIRVLLC